MPLTAEMKVELLWDKHAIAELMLQFGRALDRKDWASYRSCLADRLEVDFQKLTGFAPVETDSGLWTEFAEVALAPWLTHHQYSNTSISVRGDHAQATVYMVARHSFTSDSRRWNTQYGWYENQFERCEGGLGWRITRLGHHFQWLSGEPDLLDATNEKLTTLVTRIFGAARAV